MFGNCTIDPVTQVNSCDANLVLGGFLILMVAVILMGIFKVHPIRFVKGLFKSKE